MAKIKVFGYLGVDSKGDWILNGWKDASEEMLLECVTADLEGTIVRQYRIEAEIEVPEARHLQLVHSTATEV